MTRPATRSIQRVDYLIIGGGIAGTTAAETIRQLDREGKIVIVSEEAYPLYSRVLLPHYLRGRVARDFVFLKNEKWYEELGLTLLKGRSLCSLRLADHQAELDDGTIYHYQKLLISTGGRVKKLDLPELAGITYFRTLDDADQIRQALQAIDQTETRPPCGVVYGSGFIALEYLAIFRERKFETHLAFRRDQYWRAYLEESSERLLRRIFAQQDIHLHPQIEYVKVKGSQQLEEVDFGRQQLKTSILGIGIGLLPNLEPLLKARLAVRGGILTNEYLETGSPDVYAAGDVAEFFDLTAGRHRLLGNWVNAQQQGRRAGLNMTGDRQPFELVSAYSISPFGLTITFAGDVLREAAEKIIIRGSPEFGGVTQIFLRNNRAVGATLINMNQDRTQLTELIRKKTDLRLVQNELSDLGTDLSRFV